MEIILADPQGITRMGLMYLLQEMGQDDPRYVEDKAGLIERLKESPAEIVVLDYNLFDFNDANEMFILSQRFPETLWLLFSEELSAEFMKMVMLNGQQFSIRPFPVQARKGFGGGDGYASGFLYGLFQGWEIIDCLEFGSAEASMMVRANNCSDSLPNPEQVHAFIQEEKERYGEMIARV